MPESKVGKCPWCERHNVQLYVTYGVVDGKLWIDWICARCRSYASDFSNSIKENDHDYKG